MEKKIDKKLLHSQHISMLENLKTTQKMVSI